MIQSHNMKFVEERYVFGTEYTMIGNKVVGIGLLLDSGQFLFLFPVAFPNIS